MKQAVIAGLAVISTVVAAYLVVVLVPNDAEPESPKDAIEQIAQREIWTNPPATFKSAQRVPARAELPKTAPKALDARVAVRFLREVQKCSSPRDRAIALVPFYAGTRIAEIIGLDVDDVRLSARKGILRILGKGDQPAVAVDGFGDLRFAVVGVVDALPGGLVDRFDGGADGLDHSHPDRVLPAGVRLAAEQNCGRSVIGSSPDPLRRQRPTCVPC